MEIRMKAMKNYLKNICKTSSQNADTHNAIWHGLFRTISRGEGGAGGDEATPIFYLSLLLAFAGRQFKMRLKRGQSLIIKNQRLLTRMNFLMPDLDF